MELKLNIEFSEPFLPAEVIPDEAQAALEEALQLLEGEVVRRTPEGVFGSGGLRGSIAAEPVQKVGRGIVGIVGTNMEYGAAVEYGTKPHWPPIGPLIPWVIKKFHIADEAKAKRAARIIQLNIAHHGTPGHLMFERALHANRGRIEQIFERAGYRIAARLEKGEA